MALGLASLHSVTGLMLVRKLRRGQPLLVRASRRYDAVRVPRGSAQVTQDRSIKLGPSAA